MGQFQNCCHGIATQSLLGSNEAACWVLLSLSHTVRILWDEFIQSKAHARGLCLPVKKELLRATYPAEGNDAVENHFCFMKA